MEGKKKKTQWITCSRGETLLCFCTLLDALLVEIALSTFTDFQPPVSTFGTIVAFLKTFGDTAKLESSKQF